MYTSKKLEVILKLSEVCNIACSYCYYFFSGDDRYKERPPHLTDRTVDGLIRFVNDSYRNGDITSVQIDLHGGEPLMYGKHRFASLCSKLNRDVICSLKICMTTNGMLIDDEWIGILNSFDVNVCVSIDGPERTHDSYRVDKRNRGTHKQTVSGYWKLKNASRNGLISAPAVLCVVNVNSNPEDVYDYLVKELYVKSLDFLMPDVTHDSSGRIHADDVAVYMVGLMKRWLADDNSDVHVRTFNSVLSLLVSGRSYLAGFGSLPPLVMTVGTDGSIDTDDFLKPCGVEFISTGQNIDAATFDDVFLSKKVVSIHHEIARIPNDCSECEFSVVCRGGQATHRFGNRNRFNNKSVYCDAQFSMFRQGAMHLLNSGVDIDLIASNCSRSGGSDADASADLDQ